MTIRYLNPEIPEGALSVAVTFVNDEDKVFIRHINVPYTNNSVDLVEWNNRLNDHLNAVIHKSNVGVITFVEPTPTSNTIDNEVI